MGWAGNLGWANEELFTVLSNNNGSIKDFFKWLIITIKGNISRNLGHAKKNTCQEKRDRGELKLKPFLLYVQYFD